MFGPRENRAQTSEVLWQGIIERGDDWAQIQLGSHFEVLWQGIIECRDVWAQRHLGLDFRGTLPGDN